MRITTKPANCIASGACWEIAPEVFGQDEEGIVTVLDASPPAEHHEPARRAAAACPAAVITIEEG
jgi:ferredoxin